MARRSYNSAVERYTGFFNSVFGLLLYHHEAQKVYTFSRASARDSGSLSRMRQCSYTRTLTEKKTCHVYVVCMSMYLCLHTYTCNCFVVRT